jgi:hypothetical protein
MFMPNEESAESGFNGQRQLRELEGKISVDDIDFALVNEYVPTTADRLRVLAEESKNEHRTDRVGFVRTDYETWPRNERRLH